MQNQRAQRAAGRARAAQGGVGVGGVGGVGSKWGRASGLALPQTSLSSGAGFCARVRGGGAGPAASGAVPRRAARTGWVVSGARLGGSAPRSTHRGRAAPAQGAGKRPLPAWQLACTPKGRRAGMQWSLRTHSAPPAAAACTRLRGRRRGQLLRGRAGRSKPLHQYEHPPSPPVEAWGAAPAGRWRSWLWSSTSEVRLRSCVRSCGDGRPQGFAITPHCWRTE